MMQRLSPSERVPTHRRPARPGASAVMKSPLREFGDGRIVAKGAVLRAMQIAPVQAAATRSHPQSRGVRQQRDHVTLSDAILAIRGV